MPTYPAISKANFERQSLRRAVAGDARDARRQPAAHRPGRRSSILGGWRFDARPTRAFGPSTNRINLFFTHNRSKTNQEAAHDTFVHLYDKTDEYVCCSAVHALVDSIVNLAELHDVNLLDPIRRGGWQHVHLNTRSTDASPPGISARGVSDRAHPSGHQRLEGAFRGGRHAQGPAPASRRDEQATHHRARMRRDDGGGHAVRGRQFREALLSKHCRRQDCGHWLHGIHEGAGQGPARPRGLLPRRDVRLPHGIFGDAEQTLFPNLRRQLNSPEFLAECKKRKHTRERASLLAVLDVLDAESLTDYAMLFAQIELFGEDTKNVPLFERCRFDIEELQFLRTNHPVWSVIPALKTEGFKSLVGEMKSLWMRRETMWGEMMAEQGRCSISNVHSSVLQAKGEVAELKGVVAGLQETIEKMARDHALQMSDVVIMLGTFRSDALRCFANTPTSGLELVVTPVRDGTRAAGGAGDAGGGGAPRGAAAAAGGGARGHHDDGPHETMFAPTRCFKRPRDLFAAYHDRFEGCGPASEQIAAPRYTRTCSGSHAKLWAKVKYVVFNICARSRTTRMEGHARRHHRRWQRCEDRAVLRARLNVVLQLADAEFAQWRSEGTGPGRTLLDWCQKRETAFTEKTFSKHWAGRLWLYAVGSDAVQENEIPSAGSQQPDS